MIAHLTLAGMIHAALALLCIAVGLIQLLRPKRGAGHRARGYLYVYAVLVADGTALLVYQFTGQFNLLHAGAMLNLFCIVMAVVPLLRSPRPSNWRYVHYTWIAWSYVGLIAAAATEVVVRTGFVTRGQGWLVSLAATVTVTAIGYVMIERNRPSPEQGATAARTMQQDGVPS
jgi:uncharacterized membrane protein